MSPGTIISYKRYKKLEKAKRNIQLTLSKYTYYKNTWHIFKWLYWFIRYKKSIRVLSKYGFVTRKYTNIFKWRFK